MEKLRKLRCLLGGLAAWAALAGGLAGCGAAPTDSLASGGDTVPGEWFEAEAPLDVGMDSPVYLIDTEYVNEAGFALAGAPRILLSDERAAALREIFARASTSRTLRIPEGMDILFGAFEEDAYVFVCQDSAGRELHLNYLWQDGAGYLDFEPGLAHHRLLNAEDAAYMEAFLEGQRSYMAFLAGQEPGGEIPEDLLGGVWREVSAPLAVPAHSPVYLIDHAYVGEYGVATTPDAPRTPLSAKAAQQVREILERASVLHLYAEPYGMTVEYSAFVGQDIYMLVYEGAEGERYINYMLSGGEGFLDFEPGLVRYRRLSPEDTAAMEAIVALDRG